MDIYSSYRSPCLYLGEEIIHAVFIDEVSYYVFFFPQALLSVTDVHVIMPLGPAHINKHNFQLFYLGLSLLISVFLPLSFPLFGLGRHDSLQFRFISLAQIFLMGGSKIIDCPGLVAARCVSLYLTWSMSWVVLLIWDSSSCSNVAGSLELGKHWGDGYLMNDIKICICAKAWVKSSHHLHWEENAKAAWEQFSCHPATSGKSCFLTCFPCKFCSSLDRWCGM